MAGIVAVGGDDKVPIGEPSLQDANHLTEQLGRCFVPLPVFQVFFLGSIRRNQKRQCPASGCPGDGDENGQDDPLMSPAKRGVGVSGADRITVAALTVDVRTGMFGDRIVTG